VDFLTTIARERREIVKHEARRVSLAELRDRAEARRGDSREFLAALRRASGDPIRAIAEVKRASPSAGTLREQYDPGALAFGYAKAGAAAISVLTEPSRFLGSVEDLSRARERVSLPILQKDFVVDERQIYAARAAGADAVLLIVALLDKAELLDFAALAAEIGLEVLAEVHEEAELEIAVEIEGAIGVNNRDLHTLEVRRGWAERLLPRIPSDRVRVAESGYRQRAEIEALAQLGADAVLIGEALLRSASPGEALAALFGRDGAAGESGERDR
jgi:indole-3-glycerol phosphate synthase